MRHEARKAVRIPVLGLLMLLALLGLNMALAFVRQGWNRPLPDEDRHMRHEARIAVRVPALGLLVLLALLGLNIVLAFVRLGWIRPLIAPLISVVMALIVLTWWMRLNQSAPTLRLVAAAGFLWLALMIGLQLTDYLARPLLPPPW